MDRKYCCRINFHHFSMFRLRNHYLKTRYFSNFERFSTSKEVITNPSMLYIAIGILGVQQECLTIYIYTVVLYKPEITPELLKEKKKP